MLLAFARALDPSINAVVRTQKHPYTSTNTLIQREEKERDGVREGEGERGKEREGERERRRERERGREEERGEGRRERGREGERERGSEGERGEGRREREGGKERERERGRERGREREKEGGETGKKERGWESEKESHISGLHSCTQNTHTNEDNFCPSSSLLIINPSGNLSSLDLLHSPNLISKPNVDLQSKINDEGISVVQGLPGQLHLWTKDRSELNKR